MTIFRLLEKLYRRDEFLDEDFLKDDPNLVKIYGPSKIITAPTRKYNEDQKKLGIVDKRVLNQLKKDIQEGFLIINNPKRRGEDKTHYLGDFSKLGKYHTFSKRISDAHRLNYRIYPPKVETDTKTGEKLYLKKVVLVSCYGHETEEGDYLNDKNLRARKNRMRGNAPYRKPESIMKKKKR